MSVQYYDLPNFFNFETAEKRASGVGMVTTDGMWEPNPDNDYKNEDIKILGFCDRSYLSIAIKWYQRLDALGYVEHYIVAHDELAYNQLTRDNYRVLPCIIENPDYTHRTKVLWQQIMSARLTFTRDLLMNGTHVLVTDVDNIFSRYVPLYGFLEQGYDAFHSYEMRYPTDIHEESGFVICSGHQFLRSSPGSLRFIDLVVQKCKYSKCDDQIVYNIVFSRDLKIKWNGIEKPDHERALRINATGENANLLVESVSGTSTVTNHTIKIWDRDFAWRLAGGIPEHCPSIYNWVAMPTKLDPSVREAGRSKIDQKIAAFDVWDKLCRFPRLRIG